MIYLVRPSEPGEPGALYFRAWLATETGRIDNSHPLGEASTMDTYGITGAWWISTKDTDALNGLPADAIENLISYDDVIRAELKLVERDPGMAEHVFREPPHAYLYKRHLSE